MLLNDKKVYVGHHVGKKERLSKVEELRAQFTNVYIKNVDLEVTDAEFEDLVKPFGPTISVALSRDEKGVSKGFGFVNYENHESARKAVDELNEKEVNGKKLYAGRAQTKSEREAELKKSHEEKRLENEAKSAGVNLYVKNLDGESNPFIVNYVGLFFVQMSGMTTVSVPSSRLSAPSPLPRL